MTFGGGRTTRAFAAEIKRELGVDARRRGLRATATSTGSPTTRPRSSRWAGSPTTRARTTSSGILLGTGSSNNYGRWTSTATSTRRSPTALATTDPAATRAAFDTAEGIVRDEAPVIPLSYDIEWSLSRTGLLGAQENGLGITPHGGAGVAGPMTGTSRP